MIQNIGDYENWRDSQHDRPMPDSEGPEERRIRRYTHDYPGDTVLEYTVSGNRAELRLAFSSEDPDMGTEEMIYGGDNGESMYELAADLRAELSAYMDYEDTSSFSRQQSLSRPPGIHSLEDYLGEYSRTALYAFEGILQQTEREAVQNMHWELLPPDRLDWVYSDSGSERDRACIGHLRGDFGRGGDEFWTGWFDHQPNLKSKAFRDEFQDVVNGLRRENGLLRSFSVMSKKCRDGLPGEESFSFQGQTANHLYCLRCIPRRGDYNFYLYAYDKNILREQARKQSPQAQDMTPKKPHKTRKNEMER